MASTATSDSLDRTGYIVAARRLRRAHGRRHGSADAVARAADAVERFAAHHDRGRCAGHVHAARHGRGRRRRRLAVRSHRPRGRRPLGRLHLHDLHRSHRLVQHLHADRVDALRVGLRPRRRLQHRHAARGGIHADAHPHHGARHPAGRLVGRLRAGRAAVVVRDAAVWMAAAVHGRDRARRRDADPAARRARSAELARGA